ncbi:U-box domain-containing protein 24 [Linum grandiflorum]
MALDAVTSASFPGSELLSHVVDGMAEIINAAKGVILKTGCFQELAAYLERIVPVLKELNTKNVVDDSESLTNAIEILNREVKAAKLLTADCTTKNKVYLLINCRTITKHLQQITREISRAISLIPLASLDLSSGVIEEITDLCVQMQRAEFKAAVAEEEILEKIESGIQERKVDRSYANSLVAQIAQAVGISNEQSALKKELEEFKDEVENTRLRKDQAEAIQMDQIIALLERADAASSPQEKERKYFTKRKSLGSQPLEPLQSFYCPITRDVMVDPVETSSGQTFERSAIEKWMAEGNNLCPLTQVPLDTSILRPNKTLKQSIEEWKDRNTMITIATMKSKLESEEEEEVLESLRQLKDLCQQNDQHRQWMILENYIPVLIQLLSSKNREVRNNTLAILCYLAKDSDDAKGRVANVNDAINLIGRSLGRRTGERKLAVALLLELSKSNKVREFIGKVQGCILLLVTMSRSDDSEAATDAQQLLDNLSFSDHNIIQMAKANCFRHFLQRLSTGPDEAKIMMASTLAETELTDHNKASLFNGDVLSSLLQLATSGDIQMKTVAVRALQNLSSLPGNALQMIKQGIVRPLLEILFRHSSPSSNLREQVAITIMHLARSTASQEPSPSPISMLETDEDTFMLFSLVNLTAPGVQERILQTFQALCQSPSASFIKAKLIESSGVQVLVQLCEHENSNVRSNAVKLFCLLVKDGDKAIMMEHIGKKYVETLVGIIQKSDETEEVACSISIISYLPEEGQITDWLLSAGALQIISKFLQDSTKNNKNNLHKNQLVENAARAMCRFVSPANLERQKKAAEIGVIPVLVKLLLEYSESSNLTRKYASICLERFSKSSPSLSQPLKRHKGIWCFSAQQEPACIVHGGICTVESSFCLVEADAVQPLVMVLEDSDPEVCEASLDALLTLIEAERLQSGSKVLSEAEAILPMIKFLSCSSSPKLQEKALSALERIFRLPEYKQKYGGSAQMPLVDLTQRGSNQMKSLSARILAHLNVLHDQSSYF